MKNQKSDFLENITQDKETHKHNLNTLKQEIQALTKSNIFLKDSLNHVE